MDSWIHLLTKKSQHTVFRVCLQIRQRAFISYYLHSFLSIALLKNHQGGHIYQQTENLHTVCVQTAERRRRLQRPIRLARFMFFDVKFGLRHVA